MKKKEEELWIRALKDDGKAFRKLERDSWNREERSLPDCVCRRQSREGMKKAFSFITFISFPEISRWMTAPTGKCWKNIIRPRIKSCGDS